MTDLAVVGAAHQARRSFAHGCVNVEAIGFGNVRTQNTLWNMRIRLAYFLSVVEKLGSFRMASMNGTSFSRVEGEARQDHRLRSEH